MTKIIIEAIEPSQMRLPEYREPGCGDWLVNHATGDIHIQVAFTTDIVDDDEAFLLAIHEMIEFKLCHKAGVNQGAVDAFDKQFEQERSAGQHADDAEPGDDPRAPYQRQHRAACMIEHLMAIFLGKWNHGEVR